VPAYGSAIAGTHCTYPETDGPAELTWVAGYIPMTATDTLQVLTETSITSLMDSNVLTHYTKLPHTNYCKKS